MTAAEFAAAVSSGQKLPGEPYLDAALTEWLPAMAATGDAEATAALKQLAAILVRENEDDLLAELLRSASMPGFREAAGSLAMTVAENAAGHRDAAYRGATEAARRFRALGNHAGAVRADVEAVYALRGAVRTEECVALSESTFRAMEGHRYPWAYIQLLMDRSTCLSRLGDFAGSQHLLDEATQLSEDRGYDILLLRAIGLTASHRSVIGDVVSARRLDSRGLERFWQGAFPALRAYQFYSDFTFIAERTRDWNLGYLASRESIPMIQIAGNRTTEAMARYRLAMFAGMTGRREESLEQMRQADVLLKGTPRAARAETLIWMANAYLENGETGLAGQALNLIEPADVAGSRYFELSFRRARGIVALRSGRLGDAKQEFDAAVRAAELGFGDRPSATDRAIWLRQTAPAHRDSVGLILDQDNNPELALAMWERYRSARLDGSPADWTGVESLRKYAAQLDRSTVLSFVQLEDRLQGWMVDDRGIRAFDSPLSWRQASDMCSEFRDLSSRAASEPEALRRSARKVYRQLIEPVESLLDGSRVLAIEPDGPCSGISFEALLDARGEYLIDRFTILTSPGAPAALALARQDASINADLHVVAIGNPYLSGDAAEVYPPLSETRLEAEEVGGRFRTHTILSGRAATPAALEKLLPGAEVLHFSGHGVTTDADGRLLLASGDPGQGAAMIGGERLAKGLKQCRLVVLSACSTAAGEQRGPFNPDSLVQSLWRAGVPNVLATRWAVDSQVARRVVNGFYDRVLRGTPPATALRAAVLEIRNDPKLAHPAYWAGFHIFGNPIPGKERRQ